MAFQTGTSTDLADLISDMLTFATSNGWTQDENASGRVAFHRGNIYVSMRYDTGSPSVLSVYQALAWSVSTEPGSHTDDSGNGYNGGSWTNALGDDERHVADIGNGPYTYWFFEQDTYLHVVVEVSTDIYRHFGFGSIVKTGDWTGGEYVYGQEKVGLGVHRTDETVGLSGAQSQSGLKAATLHMEGLPGQGASEKWGQVWGTANARPNDTAGEAKGLVHGGVGAGPNARIFGDLGGLPTTSALLGLYPIELYYMNLSTNFVYYLGYQPDVRIMDMEFFAPAQTITIGSDTWYVFPFSQKATSGGDGSYYAALAYRRDNG